MQIRRILFRKGFSEQNLAVLKQIPESTVLNGTPCRLIDRAAAGDRLEIHIREPKSSSDIIPVKLPLEILYEDEDLTVVNKPAGMPTHPSGENRDNTLANALAWYYRDQEEGYVFRSIGRLDRDTSGLLIVARHMVSGSILSSMLSRREIRREYLGIVRGLMEPVSGTIDLPLGRKSGPLIERFVDPEGGQKALTRYQVLKYANGHSLVSIKLETGRTHQIRAHMKAIGWPLAGDYLYNPDMEFISRQALHSWRLTFRHPVTEEPMQFTAPLPEDMAGILS